MRNPKAFGTLLILLSCVAALAWGQRPDRPQGQRGPGRDGPPMNPILRLLDANQDGAVSANEMENAAAKLKALDANKDGKVTDDELRSAMGFRPGGPPPGGPGGAGGPGGPGVAASEFEKPPVPKDDSEKKILEAIEAMRSGPRFANVPASDGRLLRLLAETVGAKRVVEIGTSTGESAVWFALALRKTGGRLFTHEIDPGRAKVAQENFNKAGVADLITLILGDAHETVKQHKEPIDILFLDADKEGYIDYLEKLVPLVRPGGLIIAHNMNPRQADRRYVEAITKNPDFETAFLLMERSGVGVTMKKR